MLYTSSSCDLLLDTSTSWTVSDMAAGPSTPPPRSPVMTPSTPSLSRHSSADTIATEVATDIEDDNSLDFLPSLRAAGFDPRHRGLAQFETPINHSSPIPMSSRDLLNAPRRPSRSALKRRPRSVAQRVYDHDWTFAEEEELKENVAESRAGPVRMSLSDLVNRPVRIAGSGCPHSRFQQSLSTASSSSSTRQAVSEIRSLKRNLSSCSSEPNDHQHAAALGRAAKEMVNLFFSDEELGYVLSEGEGKTFAAILEKCKVAKDARRKFLTATAADSSDSSAPSTPTPSPRKGRPLRREPTMLFDTESGEFFDPRPRGHNRSERLFGSLKSPFELRGSPRSAPSSTLDAPRSLLSGEATVVLDDSDWFAHP